MNYKNTFYSALSSLVVLAISTTAVLSISGCGAVHIYYAKSKLAIQRDSLINGSVKSTIQDPEEAKNGTIKLPVVENIEMVKVKFPAIKGASGSLALDQELKVPKGYSASVFAYNIGRPQKMVIREDGTMFVSDLDGRILAIKSTGEVTPIITELVSPFGLELHKGALYYTDENNFYRFNFDSPTAITGKSTVLNKRLPKGQQHFIRPVKWVEADKMFYITVGSSTNNNIETDNIHGVALRLGEDGGVYDVAARGLRNTSALDVNPNTGELWGIDQSIENYSADLPPDELNVIKVGKHYGWPFLFSDNYRDPSNEKLTAPKKSEKPLFNIQGLSFPTDMDFYSNGILGEEWKNSFLLSYHGSLNRTPLSGYSVVRINYNQNGTNPKQTEVVSGFTDSTGVVWGKPTGVVFTPKGDAFYVSDDYAGAIYKIFKK